MIYHTRGDITEILLKVALKTISLTPNRTNQNLEEKKSVLVYLIYLKFPSYDHDDDLPVCPVGEKDVSVCQPR
jgi:hypothetical protein